MSEQVHEYDGPAEQRTVTGWVCTKCNRYYGHHERSARYCCSTHGRCTECGGKTTKPWTKCDACQQAETDAKFLTYPQRDWTDEPGICTYDNDTFIWDQDDLAEHIHALLEDNGEDLIWDNIRFVHVKEKKKRQFEACDLWVDDVTEDQRFPDATEIEKAVNEWGEQHIPKMYYSTNVSVTQSSIRSIIGEELAAQLDANTAKALASEGGAQ